jgi:hypothetical protein
MTPEIKPYWWKTYLRETFLKQQTGKFSEGEDKSVKGLNALNCVQGNYTCLVRYMKWRL